MVSLKGWRVRGFGGGGVGKGALGHPGTYKLDSFYIIVHGDCNVILVRYSSVNWKCGCPPCFNFYSIGAQ